MVVIHVSQISPRIAYVMKQVFTGFLQTPYRISEQPVVPAAGEFVIDYTSEKGQGHLHILPSGLLNETGIRNFTPELTKEGLQVKLFPNDSQFFQCDVFSAIFWMLSRYEEYQPYTFDKHGRFPATASLAFKKDFILIPVVDQWVESLAGFIEHHVKGILPERKFNLVCTIDVDNAFAYRGKGFTRQTGALLKHFFKGQWAELGQRLKVLRGKHQDPFDNYAYIRQLSEKHGVKTIFFHLVGDLAAHDRNISPESPAYAQLLGQLKTWSVQGLHPSYQSGIEPALVKKEKNRLEKAAGMPVTHSRQHFLRLSMPGTYRNLVATGITHDFSMGFADHIGFRAGTGRAFTFFDLEANAGVDLLIQPLCIMEGTLRDYMGLNPEEAIVQIRRVKNFLQALNSTYVAVWHNETLGDYREWKGWKKVYESQFIHEDPEKLRGHSD